LAQVQALTYHSGSPVSNEIGVRDRDAGEQSAVPLAGEKDIEVGLVRPKIEEAK
jgi:hypothetical protein